MVNINIIQSSGLLNPHIQLISYNEEMEYVLPENFELTEEEKVFINEMLQNKFYFFRLPRFGLKVFLHFVKFNEDKFRHLEEFRIEGASANKALRKYKFSKIVIASDGLKELLLAYVEGLLLSDYRFEKYKSEKEESMLNELSLLNKEVLKEDAEKLCALIESVYIARDLVNEPASVLTAVELSKRIVALGKEKGFYTEIFNKAKIEALKMGGLLAVNQGSIDLPTFSILEWKPKKPKNQKPYILIGKGIVFDSGGLSLKPTANSMDYMKSDMAGAAAVIGVLCACAALKLNIHVIAIVPATDNRPGEKAYAPGDIVKMYDGSTVEVLNTDAEGRMILADALSYSKKYDPNLVIDIATLTGAASVAIGKYGIVAFTNKDRDFDPLLLESGNCVYERLVPFPMWDEYAELIKSDIADAKNIGGKDAGAITAAKFLERFTDYPWIHLDIAGSAFQTTEYKYLTKGGSGVGVRLILNYLQKIANNE